MLGAVYNINYLLIFIINANAHRTLLNLNSSIIDWETKCQRWLFWSKMKKNKKIETYNLSQSSIKLDDTELWNARQALLLRFLMDFNTHLSIEWNAFDARNLVPNWLLKFCGKSYFTKLIYCSYKCFIIVILIPLR